MAETTHAWHELIKNHKKINNSNKNKNQWYLQQESECMCTWKRCRFIKMSKNSYTKSCSSSV